MWYKIHTDGEENTTATALYRITAKCVAKKGCHIYHSRIRGYIQPSHTILQLCGERAAGSVTAQAAAALAARLAGLACVCVLSVVRLKRRTTYKRSDACRCPLASIPLCQ